MKTAKEIFIEVWKEWFGDEDNDQLNIALKHDYIFESMERYKQVSVEPEVKPANCEHPRDQRDYIGNGYLKCRICKTEFK